MKKLFLTHSLVAMAFCANAAKVVYSTGGVLTYTATNEDAGKIEIIFKKCMQNNLYTFYRVKLNNKVVNQTSSDNIGPFFAGGVFMGGNHNTPQGGPKPSAYTRTVKAYCDGEELVAGTYDNVSVVKIEVFNEIYYTDDKKFCDENITYTVSGNSIDVQAEHTFHYPSPLNVGKYYGAQSMFPGTELLIAGTNDNKWLTHTPYVSVEHYIYKKDIPNISTYVEKSANGYQAVCKYPEGMGDAAFVSDDGPVFIWANYGGATGKSYHVMMWNHTVKAGDVTNWHALYSWFAEPLTDTFRLGSENPVFEYPATIDGVDQTLTISADGKTTSGISEISVDESDATATYYNLQGVAVDNPANGVYIRRLANGKSDKVLVK